MAATLDVVCPPGAQPGMRIDVSHNGDVYGVNIPDGVSEGQTFLVDISDGGEPVAFAAESKGDPVGDAPGGLQGLAAELEGQRAIVASFLEGDSATFPAVKGSEVLAEALRLVLRSIARMDELDKLIDDYCAAFADYLPNGEQRLEWTNLHNRYVALVEDGVAEALEDMECSAEELAEYARSFHTDGSNAEADRLLTKFLAMGEYSSFCAVMKKAHECPMSV